MAGTIVDLRTDNGVATLLLVPPLEGKPPTMDLSFFDLMESAIETVERRVSGGPDAGSETIRLVVLRSASDRFFCAGGDIAALETLTAETMERWIRRGHDVLARLEALPVPVVAIVAGYALGGGLELALACDLILASHTASLGQTEARLGFVSGWGGSLRLLRRVGLTRAKELFFTATVVTAETAERLGIVDYCGTEDALEERLSTLAEEIRAAAPEAVAAMKQILGSLADERETAGLTHQMLELELTHSIRLVEHPETKSRVHAFLQKRK